LANIVNGTSTGSGGLITTGDSSDELQLQTAETARVTLTNTAVVVNEGGNDVDFRVEGDTDANTLFVDAGNDRVGVKTATPAVALDVVGQVRASTGILFGSDTAAANALDDYEEGTWTPVLQGTGSNPSVGYLTQVGIYTKIGNRIFVSGRVTINSISGGSGDIQITLPIQVGAANNQFPGVVSVGSVDFSAGYTFIVARAITNTSTFVLEQCGDNVGQINTPISAIGASADIIFNFAYQV